MDMDKTRSEVKKEKEFRDYSSAPLHVKQFYMKQRKMQTLKYASKMLKKYCSSFTREMTIWEVAEHLNHLVDISDPDLDLPNLIHGLQAAESARADDQPDWMILTCLIHDFGKIIYKWGCDKDGTSQEQQWGLVGDTFILGCRLPHTLILPEYNNLNPDQHDQLYETELGIYEPHCGLNNCYLAFGHDEYMYRMLKHNETNLPEEALYIIRYHSLYAWHDRNEYKYLTNEKDVEMLPWVKQFNKYDLYSKSDKTFNLEELKPYYQGLIDKYLPNKLYW